MVRVVNFLAAEIEPGSAPGFRKAILGKSVQPCVAVLGPSGDRPLSRAAICAAQSSQRQPASPEAELPEPELPEAELAEAELPEAELAGPELPEGELAEAELAAS
jgi:hypothetical protein